MTRWFRFYDDVINDPKVLCLSSDALRWQWVSLLCVASKSDGKLPPTKEIAIYLRIKPQRVAALVAELVRAGLLDRHGDTYRPHNWDGRQYKSDSSAERVKRHREKRAAAGLQSQWTVPKVLREAVYERDAYACVYCGSTERLSLDHRTPEIRGGTHDFENLATACLACNGAKRDMTETEYREYVTLLKRPQITENRIQINDDADDARAKPSVGNLTTPEALQLAEKLLVIAGHDPSFWPPGWCGAPMRVQTWLDRGWPPEIIVAATQSGAKRKHGPPASSVQFFENSIAEEIARQSAPLPEVQIRQAEKLTVTTHAKPRSAIIQAADDLCRKLASFDGPARGADGIRGGAGETSPRLLSNG